MDTRFIESLLSVIEHGSIVAGARHQGLTPAAVGQRIRALEQELGVVLLQRVSNKARPTRSCEKIIPRMQHIVRQARMLSTDTDPTGLTGLLRVGVIDSLTKGIVPEVMQRMQGDHPNIHLKIVPGISLNLYNALIDGSLDVVLIVMPAFSLPKYVKLQPLISEPLVLIAAEDVCGNVLAALNSVPYIRYDASTWDGAIAEQYLRSIGAHPNLVCDIDCLETITTLVENGIGCSLVPRWLGNNWDKHQIFVSEALPKKFSRQICTVAMSQPDCHPMVEAFLAVIDELLAVENPKC